MARKTGQIVGRGHHASWWPIHHFRRASTKLPNLIFILTIGDVDDGTFASYRSARGNQRQYRLPRRVHEVIMAGLADDDDGDYWLRHFDCMDRVESRWTRLL